ncbi:non-hydrolyzing UDP-N-acetylglucosamine 2-epimerase [Pseudohoeflea coraliihabitans]|uniref:UDP-N-acetylglucosamine 2-epimerase (non-hydrolyzing) n=1 Tax=Pseudohoeflea coraliihabitans TaxID=2860393 RepID=A0ABS6WLQ9_9HYPH|nr:UDP-N-acetylglucosamine 2-epimerase (non-hydrolyzing) [Pseudohoeflea sp. DP4N28-3]MBW3096894.1 UDP-N-acetylglucosamine 2-epimerase (non-hydrolyzing) [Pseudohoeflea sp. DP4N28-3]
MHESRRRILCIVGTRPEAIKMAPVILALRQQPWADLRVAATAQHRHLLDQVFEFFDIAADIDLDVMRPNQTLSELTARLLTGLDDVLAAEKPAAVLAQGDTTTVMVAALACFYRHIAFGHVEAGLRTGNIDNPFPEEANRVIAGLFAKWHFAPTKGAGSHLLASGVRKDAVHVVGNTVIDALFAARAGKLPLPVELADQQRLILVTAHRRENFGAPFLRICKALRALSQANPETRFLFPVHPNPNVRDVAHQQLSGCSNFILCEPLEYAEFIAAMDRSHLILTDSGGVQEEAPALGKPVLVLRDETERPEAVEEGVVKLVGTQTATIVREAQLLLDDERAWSALARGISPYGDGEAANRIASILKNALSA